MSGFFSSKAQPLPPIPDRQTPEVKQAADDQRRALAAAKGRASTFLGGGEGDPLRQKTLLGA